MPNDIDEEDTESEKDDNEYGQRKDFLMRDDEIPVAEVLATEKTKNEDIPPSQTSKLTPPSRTSERTPPSPNDPMESNKKLTTTMTVNEDMPPPSSANTNNDHPLDADSTTTTEKQQINSTTKVPKQENVWWIAEGHSEKYKWLEHHPDGLTLIPRDLWPVNKKLQMRHAVIHVGTRRSHEKSHVEKVFQCISAMKKVLLAGCATPSVK